MTSINFEGLYLELDVIRNFSDPLLILDNQDKVLCFSRAAPLLFPKISTDIDIYSVIPELNKKSVLTVKNKNQPCHIRIETRDNKVYGVNIIQLQDKIAKLLFIFEDNTEKDILESLLQQNEKMAILGTTTANMTHEINNVLGSVIQGVQNINRRLKIDFDKNIVVADDIGLSLEKLQQYISIREIDVFLDSIKDAVTRATNIINNTLEYSRKSSSMREVNINQLLADTLLFISRGADVEQIATDTNSLIKTKFATSLPPIKCNPEEIEQVIINLIKNAIAVLTNTSEPQILVTSEEHAKNLEISVTDNGPGIPDGYMPKLFEAFASTKPHGTGLGLHICKYIIEEKHNWELQVATNNGGTKFTICIPKDLG